MAKKGRKRRKRIKVRGHYRVVSRNSSGRFKSVKKWSSKKKNSKRKGKRR